MAPWIHQPEGFRPHPVNIFGACFFCRAASRDIPDPSSDTGFRRELVFGTGVQIETEQWPEGEIAVCESCLVDNARRLLGMLTVDEYAVMKDLAEQSALLRIALHASDEEALNWQGRFEDLENEMTVVVSQRDIATNLADKLTHLDATDALGMPAMREMLAEANRRADQAEGLLINRDAVIAALRRGLDPPDIKRRPGRPSKIPLDEQPV